MPTYVASWDTTISVNNGIDPHTANTVITTIKEIGQ